MIDLANKRFITENDSETEALLKIAVSQGFKLPKGAGALKGCRYFTFVGSPYKTVSCPKLPSESSVTYAEVFGNESDELENILNKAMRYCRSHGYAMFNIYVNECDTEFTGKAVAKTKNSAAIHTNITLPKPRKVTLEEIEAHFGYPVEIV